MANLVSVSVSAYILIQTEVGKAASVAEGIREIPGVIAADDVTGPYDVVVRVQAESMDELTHPGARGLYPFQLGSVPSRIARVASREVPEHVCGGQKSVPLRFLPGGATPTRVPIVIGDVSGWREQVRSEDELDLVWIGGFDPSDMVLFER